MFSYFRKKPQDQSQDLSQRPLQGLSQEEVQYNLEYELQCALRYPPPQDEPQAKPRGMKSHWRWVSALLLVAFTPIIAILVTVKIDDAALYRQASEASNNNNNNNNNATTTTATTTNPRRWAAYDGAGYVDTFRGGAVIGVPQDHPGGGAPAIRTVSAAWNVPWFKPNAGADLGDVDNRHEMGQWVGITGGACEGEQGGALLQAGTHTILKEDGSTVAEAWVEWLPAGVFSLSPENMTVHPGDHIRVSIRVDNAHEGFVHMKNLATDQTWSGTVSDPTPAPGSGSGSAMCFGDGTAWYMDEWVLGVPGASPDADRTALPVFDNLTFSGAEAWSRSGRRFDLAGPGADLWDMTQRGTGKPVALAEARGRGALVVYSPEGSMWVGDAPDVAG